MATDAVSTKSAEATSVSSEVDPALQYRELGAYNGERVKQLQQLFRHVLLHRRLRGLAIAYRESEQSRTQRTRLAVISEIIGTEEAYVSSLQLVINEYIKPLRLAQGGDLPSPMDVPTLSSSELAHLFANLETLHTLNRTLLTRLRARESKFPLQYTFGDVFSELIPAMKLYIDYVNNFSVALKLYKSLLKDNKMFVEFLQRVRESTQALGVEHDLPTLLIMPVQRIPRYELLLKEALRHTDERHPDKGLLTKALMGITDINQWINEKKKEQERAVHVFDIEKRLISVDPDFSVTSLYDEYVTDTPAVFTEITAQLKRRPGHAYLTRTQLILARSETSFASPMRAASKKGPGEASKGGVNAIVRQLSHTARKLSVSLVGGEGLKRKVSHLLDVRIALDELAVVEKGAKAENLLVRVVKGTTTTGSTEGSGTSSPRGVSVSSSPHAFANAWELVFEERHFPEFYRVLKETLDARRIELKLPPLTLPDVTSSTSDSGRLTSPRKLTGSSAVPSSSSAPALNTAASVPVLAVGPKRNVSRGGANMGSPSKSPRVVDDEDEDEDAAVAALRHAKTLLALEVEEKSKAMASLESEKRALALDAENMRELFALASKRLAVLESTQTESEKVARLLDDNEKLLSTIALLSRRVETLERENKELRFSYYQAQNNASISANPKGDAASGTSSSSSTSTSVTSASSSGALGSGGVASARAKDSDVLSSDSAVPYDLPSLVQARPRQKLLKTATVEQIFGRKRNKRRDVILFLFDDVLIVARPWHDDSVGSGSAGVSVRQRFATQLAIPLKHMSVTDIAGLEGVQNAVRLEDLQEGEALVLDMGAVAIKLEWLKALRDNIKEFQRQRMAQMLQELQLRERDKKQREQDALLNTANTTNNNNAQQGGQASPRAPKVSAETRKESALFSPRLQSFAKAFSFRKKNTLANLNAEDKDKDKDRDKKKEEGQEKDKEKEKVKEVKDESLEVALETEEEASMREVIRSRKVESVYDFLQETAPPTPKQTQTPPASPTKTSKKQHKDKDKLKDKEKDKEREKGKEKVSKDKEDALNEMRSPRTEVTLARKDSREARETKDSKDKDKEDKDKDKKDKKDSKERKDKESKSVTSTPPSSPPPTRASMGLTPASTSPAKPTVRNRDSRVFAVATETGARARADSSKEMMTMSPEPLPVRLAKILSDEGLRVLWLEYVNQTYCAEWWQFFELAASYKRTKSRTRRRQLQYELIERFLVPGASEELPVERAIVQPVLDDYAAHDYACTGDVTLFDAVFLVVQSFLEEETALRFFRKPKVVNYLKGVDSAARMRDWLERQRHEFAAQKVDSDEEGANATGPAQGGEEATDWSVSEMDLTNEADAKSAKSNLSEGTDEDEEGAMSHSTSASDLSAKSLSAPNSPLSTSGGSKSARHSLMLENSSNATLQRLAKANSARRLSRTMEKPPAFTLPVEPIAEGQREEHEHEAKVEVKSTSAESSAEVAKATAVTVHVLVSIPSLKMEFKHSLVAVAGNNDAAYDVLMKATATQSGVAIDKIALKLGELSLKSRHLNYLQNGDVVEATLTS